MFSNPHLNRVREIFAAQFTSEHGMVVYRKNGHGAPIPLSAEERDRLISRFERRLNPAIYGFVAIASLAVTGVVVLNLRSPGRIPGWIEVAGVVLLFLAFFATMIWITNDPARTLAGRTPVGEEIPAADYRRAALSRLSWSKLGTVAGASLLPALRIRWDRNLFTGENLLWVLLGGVMLLVVAIQSVRKLLLQRALVS